MRNRIHALVKKDRTKWVFTFWLPCPESASMSLAISSHPLLFPYPIVVVVVKFIGIRLVP